MGNKVTIHDPRNWDNTYEVDLGEPVVETGAPVHYTPGEDKTTVTTDVGTARRGRPRKSLRTDTEPENGIYYTVNELAELLGVNKHTIQARLRDGTIRGRKLSGEWRIYRDALTNA